MDADEKRTRGDRPSGGAAKAPYVKPAFRHEKVFETMALACGKISQTQPTCIANRKTS